jgi:hypothetical protein
VRRGAQARLLSTSEPEDERHCRFQADSTQKLTGLPTGPYPMPTTHYTQNLLPPFPQGERTPNLRASPSGAGFGCLPTPLPPSLAPSSTPPGWRPQAASSHAFPQAYLVHKLLPSLTQLTTSSPALPNSQPPPQPYQTHNLLPSLTQLTTSSPGLPNSQPPPRLTQQITSSLPGVPNSQAPPQAYPTWKEDMRGRAKEEAGAISASNRSSSLSRCC